MDRASVRIQFTFNYSSQRQVRARETTLRLNYIPARLVKRLVNQQ